MINANLEEISKNVSQIQASIPPEVTVVAAAKGRTIEEVQAAIDGGITHIGYNYVQEAERMADQIHDVIEWHMIGHLQRNKVKKALQIFDLIETVDSVRLARAIDRRCANLKRTMPVFVEINSGREASKSGVLPEEVDDLVTNIIELPHIRVNGLMTMGPAFVDPEQARPYFKITQEIYRRLLTYDHPNLDVRYLSMGMTNSYRVAIEEGANIIRLGTAIFGPLRK